MDEHKLGLRVKASNASNKVYDFVASESPAWVILTGIAGFMIGLLLLIHGTDMHPRQNTCITIRDSTSTGVTTFALEVIPQGSLQNHSLNRPPSSDCPPAEETGFFYNKYPLMLMWSLLMAVMCGFSLSCAPVFGAHHKWLRARSDRADVSAPENIVAAVLIGLTLFFVPRYAPGIWGMTDIVDNWHLFFKGEYVLWIPLVITIASAVLGILVMLSISSASLELVQKAATTPGPPTILERYERLDAILRQCLTLLSVLVVFSVLTSGTLRVGIMSMVKVPGLDFFPERFVHAYGLFFTAFLALIYLPIQFNLSTIGRSLNKLADSSGAPSTPSIPKPGAWDSLKLALSILAPFISSFLPDMMNVIGGK